MPGLKREQGNDLESATTARQDRNFALTDGGIITWDAGTGELAWAGTLRVRIPGETVIGIAAGSVTGLTSANDTIFIDVDRDAGTISAPGQSELDNAGNLSDGRVVLAVRGIDGKLYFRNGTVFTDGDVKTFGSLNSATDRNELIANGAAVKNVGFTFLPASNQLVVYVGGILQKLGLHYVETGTTQVTFEDEYIPSVGELVTFMNVVGGEGPPGTSSLQSAYDNGTLIEAVDEAPVQLKSGDEGTEVLLQIGHPSSTGGLAAAKVDRDGELTVNRIVLRDLTNGTKAFIFEVDQNGALRIRASASGAEYGIRLNDDDTGIEFGKFEDVNDAGESGGAFRTTTFSGTTSGVAETNVATGFTTIRGVIVSVFHSTLGRYLVSGFADAASASREFYVSWTAAGVVTVSGASNGTGVLPTALQGQNCKILVFH